MTTQTPTPGTRVRVTIDGQERAGIVLGTVRHELVGGDVTDVLDVEVTDGAASDTYRHSPAVTVPASDVLDDERPAVEVYMAGKRQGHLEASSRMSLSGELARELFEVVREANRLAREGGSVDERAAFLERKADLLAAIDEEGAL